MTTKRIGLQLLGGAALLALATGASAQIRGSKHDLGADGTAQATTSLTSEVCVFCHTPHGSDTTASVPLWNKPLGDPARFTTYAQLATSTLDGEEADVGSVSLACLSCHDGVQAMDTVLNQPGSGGYAAAGAEIDTGAIGPMTGTPIPALGTDLQNDHPIGIEYAGGGCGATTADCNPATQTSDPDFRPAQFQTINNNPVWWVDTGNTETGFTTVQDLAGAAVAGTTNVREKTDMILYTRSAGAGGFTTQGPAVECGSCHDPHEAAPTATEVSFLRIANNNSNVCLSCHVK